MNSFCRWFRQCICLLLRLKIEFVLLQVPIYLNINMEIHQNQHKNSFSLFWTNQQCAHAVFYFTMWLLYLYLTKLTDIGLLNTYLLQLVKLKACVKECLNILLWFYKKSVNIWEIVDVENLSVIQIICRY